MGGLALVLYFIGALGETYYGLIHPYISNNTNISLMVNMIFMFIRTTRNGIFFGFLFVYIGYLLSQNKLKIDSKAILLGGIVISILVGIFEFSIINKIGYTEFNKKCDFEIWLIPNCIFLFQFFHKIKLKNINFYRHLRNLSKLIFYIHGFVFYLFKFIKLNSFLEFILVIMFSLILAEIIIMGSKTKIMLKKLY